MKVKHFIRGVAQCAATPLIDFLPILYYTSLSLPKEAEMGVFRDTGHFYACVGELMDRAKLKLLPAVEPLYKVYPALLRWR